MNKSIKIFLALGLIILFSSCCTDVSKEKVSTSNSGNVLKNPASLAINKSIVSAKVEEILSNENGSFIVKALITKVEEDPAYPNLAMKGSTYNLIPNFQLDVDKKIISDSEKNKNLFSLAKQKAGYEFKAVIFFENLNGWFIQQVITN
jgi:hypothetical protein